MAGMRSDIGKFPVPGFRAREDAFFYKLTEEDSIRMISGDRTPALVSVWASNDVVQFGTIKLLFGGAGPQQTEYDTHPGDAVFYVLQGPMIFYFPDRIETYDVEKGDFMFIPAGEKYKIINYTGNSIKAVFAIAPEF